MKSAKKLHGKKLIVKKKYCTMNELLKRLNFQFGISSHSFSFSLSLSFFTFSHSISSSNQFLFQLALLSFFSAAFFHIISKYWVSTSFSLLIISFLPLLIVVLAVRKVAWNEFLLGRDALSFEYFHKNGRSLWPEAIYSTKELITGIFIHFSF